MSRRFFGYNTNPLPTSEKPEPPPMPPRPSVDHAELMLQAAAELRRLSQENTELKERIFRLESALSNAEFGLPEPKQYPPMPQQYTTGHCKEHSKPGGCQLHNLHCGYPQCDRKRIS